MNTLIDIGINLTNKQFYNEQEEIINRALDNGVEQMILTGTSVRGSQESAEIAEDYPEILFSTAGIHPHDAKFFNSESIPALKTLLKQVERGLTREEIKKDIEHNPFDDWDFFGWKGRTNVIAPSLNFRLK